jgi:hypothetical protein
VLAYNDYSNSAARIALADCVATVISSLHAQLSMQFPEIGSLLQLQALFASTRGTVLRFEKMIVRVTSAESDEDLLSRLYREVQDSESEGFLSSILLEVLAQVSAPWMEFLASWIGLQPEVGIPLDKSGTGKSFVAVSQNYWIDDSGKEMSESDYVSIAQYVHKMMTADKLCKCVGLCQKNDAIFLA